jgi:HD-GYP domain-containing protein (c-di-GMP phosphodiesterase class II)
VTELIVVAAVWCLLALIAFGVARPALRVNRREDAHELDAAEEMMVAAVPMAGSEVTEQHVAAPHERANHLIETGYMGLVHDRLCSYARVVLGVERSWLLLRDPGHANEVLVAAARGGDPEQIGVRVPADTGVTGRMLGASRPELLAPSDDGISAARGVRALATAPVTWEGTVRGALGVGTRDPGREFGADDLELLGEVAWLAGAALAGHDRRAELAGTVAFQVEALATALSVWDHHTRRHSDRVVELARTAGARMGLDPMELLELELAALLHDVGKLRVPRELLANTGPLSDAQEALVRNHPVWGAELVAGVPGLQAVALIVRHHHERIDGSGYPSGLSGVRIPVASRIVAACDAYGAMTEARPYRERRAPNRALAELRDLAGTQFDPAVVDALEAEMGREPLVPA